MNWIRPPAVAGMFYPADGSSLERELEELFAETPLGAEVGEPPPGPGGGGSPGSSPPKALVAPHAGYIYSGPVAASGYACLEALKGRVDRVVLLGPAHRYPFRGLATSTANAFGTPFGAVPLDKEGVALALKHPRVQFLDQAHEGEHSLEVHLPFLQWVLGRFSLVPLVVGESTPEEVAEVLELLWGGPETLIVVSSDLSHYLPYRDAQVLDEATARAIESLQPEGIGHEQACGRVPLGGLLLRAREEGLEVARLDLRNSGDTAGSRDRVVGYGSWVVA